MDFKEIVKTWFQNLQQEILGNLEILDGRGKFNIEVWNREEGGGGLSAEFQNGAVIEKGGVNFSAVYGQLPKVLEKSFKVVDTQFFATGVSIVLHPINPWIPIIHMNVRYFEMDHGQSWFGGGIDLTPHYINPKDAVFFHTTLKDLCDKYDPLYYAKFSTWAEEYFFIRHRKETRGVGGIFFDRLSPQQDRSLEQIFEFVKELGNTFSRIYKTLVDLHLNKTYTENEKRWQYQRRGRYVEFNLVYDQGTRFGLETNGRIESILMSLPPMASWSDTFKIMPDSQEEYTQNHLKKGIHWI